MLKYLCNYLKECMFINYEHITKLQEEITMKILIVDDHAETKCRGIIEECNKRGIEVEIKKAINPALRRICYEQQDINGIVLDMGLGTYEDSYLLEVRGGDRVLRELLRRKYNIPVLIFSTTDSFYKDKCDFVVDQMTEWNVVQEQEKFYSFLEKIAEQ